MTSRLSKFLCAAILLANSAISNLHGGTKPNILLIIADDMDYSDITCFGGQVRTPHIDALQRR